ncbi:Low conductance mechanosensitive channel YnaI [mine drainage metagenome]|uniref:Low conductance mechanosensitive channel YnaI n=1 Tax=mine drainage metagenome TaxID=410659 RepID=A0A1J5R2R1_9ZZZZ
MQDIFNYSIFGNTTSSYLMAFGIFIFGVVIVYGFKKYILNRLKKWAAKTDNSIDDFLIEVIDKYLILVVYFGVLYISLHTLLLTDDFKHGLRTAAVVLITVLAVRAVVSVVNFGLQSYWHKSVNSLNGEKQLKGVLGLINFVIWVLALVFLLDNLGVKVSAVVAGLGIGGIAVALAAQAILGDLFSYFVIFFDKPFAVGDFIIISDKMGVVEDIGIKTTRIRAIGGELLIFSNTDLTNSRVHNFKKMEQRRVVFKLGVTYQTSSEKLKAIPQMVKQAIEEQEGAAFDRGHFASYGDFSLNFEFVYYVTGADYNKYMDIQQAINLNVFEAFEKEGVEFAYPTQTLFIAKNN